jgi:hypothetical protein
MVEKVDASSSECAVPWIASVDNRQTSSATPEIRDRDSRTIGT